MEHVGQIEARSDSSAIDPDQWLQMIGMHKSLSRVPPRIGKNPLTGAPMEIRAPGSTAVIVVNGTDIGSIYWAMDGSPVLLVSSQEGMAEVVSTIAEDIASVLSVRFVREGPEC